MNHWLVHEKENKGHESGDAQDRGVSLGDARGAIALWQNMWRRPSGIVEWSFLD